MENLSLLVAKKDIELYNDLKILVCLIRKENNSKMCYGYLYNYYRLLYTHFETILYFVKNLNRSFLDSFLLDNDIDFMISFINRGF